MKSTATAMRIEIFTSKTQQHSQYRADISHKSRGVWVIDIYIKASYDGYAYGLDFKKGDYVLVGIKHSSNKSKALNTAKWLVNNNNNPVGMR